MTSKQRVRQAVALGLLGLVALLSACQTTGDGLRAPYEGRHVWAVAPLRNESGSQAVNSVKLADKLAQRLETVRGIEVLPVNRVLAAMRQLRLRGIASRGQAMKLLTALQADGLVLGNITAYEPYEPPKLGLALELYTTLGRPGAPLDVRALTKSPTGRSAEPQQRRATQPVSSVSAVFDASEPAVAEMLGNYAAKRANTQAEAGAERLYRISMDRYSEFASYAIVKRLLNAEKARLKRERKAIARARRQRQRQQEKEAKQTRDATGQARAPGQESESTR